ncbi:MAG: NUDIX hydrolase [Planctomycetaceae bacterium]|nr:NUDIX hydrolase [Planctomycetaceae bacterium]
MPPPYCYDHPRPAVTVDLVVFAFVEGSLRVLLIRRGRDPYAGKWAIPGGFLELTEEVEHGARRELKEETGLCVSGPVDAIGFFGKVDRDPRGRTITLAHAGIARPHEHQIEGSDDAEHAEWVRLDENLSLAFDHDQILERAKTWLRRGLLERQFGLELLPRSFSGGEVVALFRPLGLTREQADAWVQEMVKSGQVHRSDGPFDQFELVTDRPRSSGA